MLGDILHQLRRVETSLPGDLFEEGMDLHQHVVVEYLAHVGNGEYRLDATRGVGDDGDGARRGDGGAGGVAQGLFSSQIVAAAHKVGKGASFLGQLSGSLAGFLGDEAHELFGQFHSLVVAVGKLQQHQHVRPAHDAEADLAVGPGHLANLLQRIFVDLNDVIEKAGGQLYCVTQLVPVHLAVGGDHARQIDGTEVTGFVRKQRLLATGVGRLDFANMRGRVVAIKAIEKDHAWLAVGPSHLDDTLKDLAGVHLLDDFAVPRVDDVVAAAGLHRFHEGLSQADGDIEISQYRLIPLGHDEVHDIGMVHSQDAHVGSAAGTALLDGFGGGIKHLHKGDGAGRDPLGGKNHIVDRPDF